MPTYFISLLAVAVLCLLPLAGVHAMTDAERAQQIKDIEQEAAELAAPQKNINCPTVDNFVAIYGFVRNTSNEQLLGRPLMATVYSDVHDWDSQLRQNCAYEPMLFYITYDYGTTTALGAGERAGCIDSWRSAQLAVSDGTYVPWLSGHWEDILKIANGRWPSYVRDEAYEQQMEAKFREVYLRDPDRSNPYDDAAVMVMAYGLRPQPRNLDREAGGIGIFKGIYGYDPTSAADWDTVRAIAYSGAAR